MSLINTKVKPFTAIAYHNKKFITINEDSFYGKWSIIVFYPADFTFVCPTELGDLSENYMLFKDLGAEIYAISTDTHFSHKAWHDISSTVNKINFPMIADPKRILTKNFEVENEEEGFAFRGTFIINPDGLIKSYEINDNNIGRNTKELLRKLNAIQYVAEHPGEVCPAKWTPGYETIKPSLNLIGKI